MLSRKLFKVPAGLDVSGGDNRLIPVSAASPASAAPSAQSKKNARKKTLKDLDFSFDQPTVADIISATVSFRLNNGPFNRPGLSAAA